MNAVITAGGRVDGEYAKAAGTDVKALAVVRGATMLSRTIAALRGAGVKRIAVVGGEDVRRACEGSVDAVIPEKPRGSENIIAALRAWPEYHEPLVYATSDMPYAGADAVADFIARSPEGHFALSLCEFGAFVERFPEAPSGFGIKLAGERVVNGGLFSIPAGWGERLAGLAAQFFDARKEPWRMVRLINPARSACALRSAGFRSRTSRWRRSASPACPQPPYATARRNSGSMPTTSRNTSMQTRTPKPFRLALFWLGLQTVWGALLGISLQARSSQLASGDALVAYGHLAAIGATVAAVTQIAVGFWSDARRKRGSRRIEFYVAGAIGGAVAIAGILRRADVRDADARVRRHPTDAQPCDRTVSGDHAGLYRKAASRCCVVVAGRVAKHRQRDRRDRREPDRKRARRRAVIDGLLIGTCAATVAHVRSLAIRGEPEHAPMHLTRTFVDLFISRALVYVGFFTMVGYLFFYVTGCSGLAFSSRRSSPAI